MLSHVRDAAPLAVAAIVVPGALLVSTPWTSAAAERLGIPSSREATTPVRMSAEVTPGIATGDAHHPARAAVAAAAALTALALGTAMAGAGSRAS
jgi:hypothetical protein